MRRLSSGTVTLVFTDIVGSTELLERLGDEYVALIAEHHAIVEGAAAQHGGTRVDSAGDGMFMAFSAARGALIAAIQAQRELALHEWPRDVEVRVRMSVHTGEPVRVATGYVGLDVHRAARICAVGNGGQILVSQAAFNLLQGAIPDDVTLRDLGEHSLRGIEAAERLYQVVAPGLEIDFPPVRSLRTMPHNLPRQLSSFIGRDAEIDAARVRLDGSALVTLTGTGGVGKTRLAIEIGAHLLSSYPDGVWLVELASMTDEELVDEAVATTLRVKQHRNLAIVDATAEAIGDQRMLVILDNCEHVLGPVARLLDGLLPRCSNLRVLATSREALGVQGELLLAVPSLTLPGADSEIRDVGALAQYDAVRLFIDRARAVAPGFAITPANAEAVAQICRRLDGIPLAMELAASRVRSLPPAQIAARLDARFSLLTGGSRTALPRHRTLRAAMDWSFDLLSQPERELLPRLSVFSGSFSLEAAEAVVADDVVPGERVLDVLHHLVERSLLLADPGGGSDARFRMLETIRDYAQERLAATGGVEPLRDRHRDWFVDLVDRARPAFFSGAVQPEWIARLAADHDNLRAALRWAHDDPDGAGSELALASGMWRFWEIRGDLEEGSLWLSRAIDRVGADASPLSASALTGAGVLAAHRGELDLAAAYHEASLELNRKLGGAIAIASACNNLASVAIERNDLDRARALYTESIALSAPLNPHGTAFTTINLADLTARDGDDAEADRLLAECLALFEQVGDQWGVAYASTRLGTTARRRGDLETARQRFADAVTIHRHTGDRQAEAGVLSSLADVTADMGAIADAERLYQQSLTIRSELGDRIGLATVLERLAGVAEDRPERAATLLGAAAGIRDAIGAPLATAGIARRDQFLFALHRSAGSPAVERALAEGRTTPLAGILARAKGRD
jgi:predicted ATPase/class 3 adenylate cyclase